MPSDPTRGPYPEGSIALANHEPDQNGAQFFITVFDLTGDIPDDYPVFGQVISGMEIVREISRGSCQPNPRGEVSWPVDPVTIEQITVTEFEYEIGPPLSPQDPAATTEPTAPAAPTVAIPPRTDRVIELDAIDIAFEPATIEIDASDLPVTIRMENTGAAPHNFSIDELDIDVDVDPGETVDFEIPAGTAPGAYDFYCNVPGHKEAGRGTLILQILTIHRFDAARQSWPGQPRRFRSARRQRADPYTQRELDETDDAGSLMSLTSAELLVLSKYAKDVANGLEGIAPPAFAAEWHRIQIELYRLVSIMLETAANSNVYSAALLFDSQLSSLERDEEVALMEARVCPDFVAWAADEEDVGDATWSEARVDGIHALSQLEAPTLLGHASHARPGTPPGELPCENWNNPNDEAERGIRR